MTFNAGMTGRVPVTAPLDPAMLRTLFDPQAITPPGDGSAKVNAFGSDTGVIEQLSASSDATVSNLTFDTSALIPDPFRELGQKTDATVGRLSATAQMSGSARKQTAEAPGKLTIDKAQALLKPLPAKIDAGIREIKGLITQLKAAKATLADTDPRAVALGLKIAGAETCLRGLRSAKNDTTKEIGRLGTAEVAADLKARSQVWGGATHILADPSLSPAAKAAAMIKLAADLPKHDGSKAAATLLTTLAKAMQPNETKVYRGDVMGALATVNKQMGANKDLASEQAQIQALVTLAKPTLKVHANIAMSVPVTPTYAASTDAHHETRNNAINATYKALEKTVQSYLGPPELNTWFFMAENASGEIGRALGDKLDVATDDIGVTLSTIVSHPLMAAPGEFDDILKAGNREIYNTITPVAKAFFEAEKNGMDGMDAIKSYLASPACKALYKGKPPTYSNTEKLFQAFKYLQQAHGTTSLTLRAGLVSKFNKCLADYEQRQVLQPLLDKPDVRSYLRGVSPALSWVPPGGTRTPLLPRGGDWGDVNTRLKAIGGVSDTVVADKIYKSRLATRTDTPAQTKPGTLAKYGVEFRQPVAVAESLATNQQQQARMMAAQTTRFAAQSYAKQVILDGEKLVN
ncbi:MAG: hypothetical protein H7338_16685 [Candidatus Sericytochromatia bacterium]|nr:hypothetical protein [Candidatus Sericytochromatia bacterium]